MKSSTTALVSKVRAGEATVIAALHRATPGTRLALIVVAKDRISFRARRRDDVTR
jgi:hypothetical protein